MDASDDREMKLQRTSADRLAEFETSLPRLLWKSTVHRQAVPPGSVIRTLVKGRKAHDLVLLLEPFQEWPQLLDPKLSSLLQSLVSAFLTYMCNYTHHYWLPRRKPPTGVRPLPRAVCTIIYTLCKIRGEKVICQFMNNEPKYLEPMLGAYRAWNQSSINTADFGYGPMTWEERYVMLLWLSHLMLTPFDLSSISTPTVGVGIDQMVLQITLPRNAPPVTIRLLSVSLNHIESAGREREAARALLVRLILRPDMLGLGLLNSFVQWALSSLESNSSNDSAKTIYTYIGLLSFLAGVMTSAAKDTIAPFLGSIFQSIQRINTDQYPLSKFITSSALARKLIIKILRELTILAMSADRINISPGIPGLPDNVLEDVIEHLLNSLADKDTPVRYAASKALSVVTMRLEPAMATEVVEAVVGGLEENVLWDDARTGQTTADYDIQSHAAGSFKRNLTAVDALRWQGLVLTLSHLLFRRSPPPGQLPSILNALILALGFEQRSSVGNSIGTKVRDAACFGIWALARRYTTEELSKIDTSSIQAANKHGHPTSVLQALANEIIVAATLDSSGNIRRGASAALQELIGRHPNTVTEGISLVQVVDYHAVALRSKAIQEVAVGASALDSSYWKVILEGLLDWRGIGSSDAPSRRLSATAIGLLAVFHDPGRIGLTLDRLRESLKKTSVRQVEERHGLLLAFAAIVRENLDKHTLVNVATSWKMFDSQSMSFNHLFTLSSHRPELIAEAACVMLSALAHFSALVSKSSHRPEISYPTTAEISKCTEILNLCLLRRDGVVLDVSAYAAQEFFKILNNEEREGLVQEWIDLLGLDSSSKSRGGAKAFGIISALGMVFHYFHASDSKVVSKTQQTIINGLLSQTGPGIEIESRVAAIQSLTSGVLTCNLITAPITAVLKTCLDDYTTDERGDVGSMVRVEAIDAVGVALKYDLLRGQETMRELVARICGLATEKLDKVRFRAWAILKDHWAVFGRQMFPPNQFLDVSDTSRELYFRRLLSLCCLDWVRTRLLEGFLTSAGAGSESLLQSSRAALVHYAGQLEIHELVLFCSCFTGIIQGSISNERLLVPALDALGFLFDAGIMQCLPSEEFPWLDTLHLVQTTHYKSRSVRKLEAVVYVYSGFAAVDAVRKEALSRLCTMLLHPFPKIRNLAADAVWLAVGEQGNDLKRINWSEPTTELKGYVKELRTRFEIAI